jgi:hypothetical protein
MLFFKFHLQWMMYQNFKLLLELPKVFIFKIGTAIEQKTKWNNLKFVWMFLLAKLNYKFPSIGCSTTYVDAIDEV